MADQLPEQARKHQRESDIDKTIQKRQKTNEREEADDAVQAKTLTNICYDCLERIFDFLDLESLLNVAGTCKRLQIAAIAKFGDDFADKKVVIGPYPHGNGQSYEVHQNYIVVQDLKLCFPFLRCFGAKMSDLYILYENDHVDSYVNEYCANTLTFISYSDKTQFKTQAFQKQFKRVIRVHLSICHLQDQLPSFVDWFPNMESLSLISCSVGAIAATVHFPHLKRLVISIHYPGNLTLEHTKDLFQSNQQLLSIELCTSVKLTLGTVLDMISENKSITDLEVLVSNAPDPDATIVDLNRFAAEHPSMASLFLNAYLFAADDVLSFIQQLNFLKSFTFLVNDRSVYDRLVDQLDKEWRHQSTAFGYDYFEITLNRQ